MTYLLIYLLVGVALAEVFLWNERRTGRNRVNRIQYCMVVFIWPLVFLAVLIGRR